MKCRPPDRNRPSREAPSLAYPIRCEGCGYYFKTDAQLKAHVRAFQEDQRNAEDQCT